MSIELRVVLLGGALVLLLYILKKVRNSPVQIVDTVFWFTMACVLVILAVFPEVVYFFAAIFQVQSPVNLLYAFLVALLIVRVFLSSMEIAVLKSRVNTLSQEIALREYGGGD